MNKIFVNSAREAATTITPPSMKVRVLHYDTGDGKIACNEAPRHRKTMVVWDVACKRCMRTKVYNKNREAPA